MNKTIIININGIVFHIEEDAYEVLKNYINEVKRHFMDSADSLEITTDIENRIAEMFSEILQAENKQVIIEQDVQTIIAQMGSVADFASAEESEAYPGARPFQPYTSRRLFRDPDDHIIGGVCAGMANYFDIAAIWVRLAFVLAFVFWGSGLVAYIILWIIIPRAVSRADRMAMRGEPLDLQGFKRNFEYELKGIQSHAARLHNEARPFIYKTRDFISEFFDHLGIFLAGAGKVLLKVLGIIIMLICVGFIIGLLVMVFMLFAYDSHNIDSVFPFSIVNHEYTLPFVLGCFFLLVLPLLGLALLTSRMAFNRAAIGRTAGYTMLMIWIVAFCVVIFYSVQIASEFKSSGKISQTIAIKPSTRNVYYLKLNDVRYLSSQDSASLDIKHSFAGKIIMDDDRHDDMDEQDRSNITLNIEKSDVPQPVLVESFRARGSNYNNALINARNMLYRFTQNDSLLIFDRHIQYNDKHAWRQQKVSLTLKIPVGTQLIIDKKFDHYLDDIDIYDCQAKAGLEHTSTAPFIMAADGLQCYVTAKPDSASVKKQ